MRKQQVVAAAVVVLGVAAVVAMRGCAGRDTKGSASVPGAEGASGPSGSGRPALPGRGPSGVAMAGDAGAEDASAAKGPELVFQATWGGSRMDQVGRSRPEEGNPEAPMSLSMDGKGRMYVLDQVNGRVVRIGADGKPEGVIPLKQQEAAQDVAVTDDGKAAVLDRFSSKSVVMYDEKGNALGEIPLEGEGLEEPGLATGIFVDGKDVYVEKEHGPLLRIGTTDGQPAADRGEIPGRPTRDGLSFIKAGLTDAMEGRMFVVSTDRATLKHKFTREIKQGTEIRAILMLDSDKAGTIYLATQLVSNGTESVNLQCLEPLKGYPVGSAQLPVNTMPEETFRDMTVLDEGGVIYAVRSESGVAYQKYDCQ
jgi:hypothetical protein